MYTGVSHFCFANDPSASNDQQVGGAGWSYCPDPNFQLDYPCASFPSHKLNGTKRKWSAMDGSVSMDPRGGSSLVLGLGCSSSSSDSKRSFGTVCTAISSAKEAEESSIDLALSFDLNLSPKKPAHLGSKSLHMEPTVNLDLSLSIGCSESIITSVSLGSTSLWNRSEMPLSDSRNLLVDDESTSSPRILGTSKPQLHTSETGFNHSQISDKPNPVPFVPNLLPNMGTTSSGSVNRTSGQHVANGKTCQFKGCAKGARGASGLCIAHGGGRRCQKVGCHKGAEGRTVYCKAHGGGRRCQYLGCTKSAEGRTDYCIAHGGGKRCSHEGCTRAARGKSGLCIRHGGGKRCQMEDCTRSAEGFSGLCISHGGGRRCQFPQCTKGAQGSTMFCKAHGGGKRCTAPGCTKGAEGSTPFCKGHGGGKRCSFQGGGVCPKSVHGGTLFCVAHGGGKRCAVPECTKSARGRTDFCVRHGGGKRCKFEGCGKSAQGSTDFCKAHGGGKRCSWDQLGSELGAESANTCDRFARGKTGLCAAHSALVHDKRVHGVGNFGPVVQDPKCSKPDKMKEMVIIEEVQDDVNNMGKGWTHSDSERHVQPPVPMPSPLLLSASLSLPEGRVHRGNLMAMLKSNSSVVQADKAFAGSSELGKCCELPYNWI